MRWEAELRLLFWFAAAPSHIVVRSVRRHGLPHKGVITSPAHGCHHVRQTPSNVRGGLLCTSGRVGCEHMRHLHKLRLKRSCGGMRGRRRVGAVAVKEHQRFVTMRLKRLCPLPIEWYAAKLNKVVRVGDAGARRTPSSANPSVRRLGFVRPLDHDEERMYITLGCFIGQSGVLLVLQTVVLDDGRHERRQLSVRRRSHRRGRIALFIGGMR